MTKLQNHSLKYSEVSSLPFVLTSAKLKMATSVQSLLYTTETLERKLFLKKNAMLILIIVSVRIIIKFVLEQGNSSVPVTIYELGLHAVP